MKKEYLIDREANKVTRTVMSKGQIFTETSVCNVNSEDGDIFNVEIGKAIVDYRLELAQRKRDLKLTKDFIHEMQMTNDALFKNNGRAGTSKHYIMSIQRACEERDSQRENIKYCEMRLKQLTSGDYVTAILALVHDRRISIDEAAKYIKLWKNS